jgi:hypothetical protein
MPDGAEVGRDVPERKAVPASRHRWTRHGHRTVDELHLGRDDRDVDLVAEEGA